MNFEEYMSEAAVISQRGKSNDMISDMISANQDRVGKSVVDPEGNETAFDSVVLSKESIAIKKNTAVEIHSMNPGDRTVTTILISNDEFKNLSKLK